MFWKPKIGNLRGRLGHHPVMFTKEMIACELSENLRHGESSLAVRYLRESGAREETHNQLRGMK